MKKINVLIFPCGAENAGEIYSALRYSVHIGLLLGASSVSDHGEFRFPDYAGDMPNIHADDFDAQFLRLVKEKQIDVVFATHDSVALKLAQLNEPRQHYFLVNGDRQVTETLRYKSATYALFDDCHWVPYRYCDLATIDDWPAIVKPDCGQGGNGVQRVNNRLSLEQAIESVAQAIVVEYLPGEEITVDCFTDRNRRLIWAGPRTRERVRAGISMRSREVVLDDEITDIVETINARLALRGPWFVQLKRDRTGKWKLLEVACRIAGAMVFQRARGVNLPLMAIHDFMGRDVVALPEMSVGIVDRAIVSRTRSELNYQRIYVDLDDTLIIDGFAVPAVMAFLYQSRAQGKVITLITRHAQKPEETLMCAGVALNLFDEVIHLTSGERKSEYIQPNSLFIDNYFPERMDVRTLKDVLVLDVDAVEFYLR
ncbi:ATP-grasp domain-containing protein [Citrobacter koseri]|uniref:ATP-grasp domain-containing protein n=1 Tax=Citrobacter koseri TaxID=545 RepID=UPI002941C9EE|nr:ATP-grasp domain-containing protein [Citrobacter koseri]MEB2702709.1 ATP-grasp domain-containing protein [Citrobacter koseri]MEB2708145.1 ATP-grasp domain-containing protein [Citrobacter koseri]MEB2772559.1 ATP-grasp domain-containing protein [Citrobacter koseri]WOJ28073.1 ATP-grasp domain-containing protein [Citrobacter koseri]